ncbi:MAG: pentapeptide repeat-containing protein [Anaerolineales bacterium]|nr:pentapeptide repeat-containing protein [Anaerolineales bacterium]
MAKVSTSAFYTVLLIAASALIWLAWQVYPANPLPKLACQPTCTQVDLSGRDLAHADLNRVNLSLANFGGAPA